jgi:hypothetical protein
VALLLHFSLEIWGNLRDVKSMNAGLKNRGHSNTPEDRNVSSRRITNMPWYE